MYDTPDYPESSDDWPETPEAETLRRVLLEGELRGDWDRSDFSRGQKAGLLIAIGVVTHTSVERAKAELADAVGEGMAIGGAISSFYGMGAANNDPWPSMWRDFECTAAVVADPELTLEEKQARLRHLAAQRRSQKHGAA